MTRKRLYRITIARDGAVVFDGFYDGRILYRMKEDALKYCHSSLREDDVVELSISHEPMTRKPHEFYQQLREAEAKSRVKSARVRGIGHRWTVERNEE